MIRLDFTFFFDNALLGTGLAMDAFSVSLANGLRQPCMNKKGIVKIAAVFSVFQFAMPMIGWFCVSTIAQYFKAFEKAIPWLALILLVCIGGKMLYEGVQNRGCSCNEPAIGLSGLLVQGVATSIDALSVGFTISDHCFSEALIACLVIGVVTFFICLAGVVIGMKAGTKLAGKAGILGGAILIFIGLEIFIKSLL